ncbi:hypothetical protein [Streptomyces sp. NBC_00503]|uniref:hypothetical protein n=1 Tax=Streptomyces sp. NBC_00503 TaxID=2903659 RepID=UPI002E815139|nr:hypothetical protein [Streptomyces sp. NBC_00503]WUD85427.1 hypothetical protein OG490_35415 [Streptomyces sp. NBC_00503]
MTYLALFEDQSRRVRRSDLIAALERDWPTAVVRESQGSQESRDVVWTYAEDGQELEGYSHVDGTCIYLDSPLGLAARFALWFRGLVPEGIDLVFCDDGYNFSGSIETGMSVDDVSAITADS